MYVSPRPTDSLKSLSTQKFLFEFLIKVLFYFRNFGSVSVSTFYYNRKLLLIRLREWFCKHVFRLLLVETMASYKKRPQIDIKKFTVCSNVVAKSGTKTADLIIYCLYEYDDDETWKDLLNGLLQELS